MKNWEFALSFSESRIERIELALILEIIDGKEGHLKCMCKTKLLTKFH